MKIAFISDTHLMHEKVVIPSDVDAVLHSGDFTNRGTEGEVKRFADWFNALDAEYKVCIPGNHDFFCQEEPDAARALFDSSANSHLLIDESVTVMGKKIYGSPWQPWFYNWAFNFGAGDDQQAIDKWNEIPEDTDILLTHGPKYGTLDTVHAGYGVGCKFLKERIDRLTNLSIHSFGHIHESRGIVSWSGLISINAAMARNISEGPFVLSI